MGGHWTVLVSWLSAGIKCNYPKSPLAESQHWGKSTVWTAGEGWDRGVCFSRAIPLDVNHAYGHTAGVTSSLWDYRHPVFISRSWGKWRGTKGERGATSCDQRIVWISGVSNKGPRDLSSANHWVPEGQSERTKAIHPDLDPEKTCSWRQNSPFFPQQSEVKNKQICVRAWLWPCEWGGKGLSLPQCSGTGGRRGEAGERTLLSCASRLQLCWGKASAVSCR